MPHISTDGLQSGQRAPLPWALLRRLPAYCRTRISGPETIRYGAMKLTSSDRGKADLTPVVTDIKNHNFGTADPIPMSYDGSGVSGAKARALKLRRVVRGSG